MAVMRMGLALFLLQAVAVQTMHFDQDIPGKLPHGWTQAMTHEGMPPQWEIVRDGSAPSKPLVLAQLSRDATAGRFPLAIWEGARVRDGDVSVSFRTMTGTVDQAAGLVWRYADANNYYVARVNALESNVVLYKVQAGVRSSIAPKGLPSRSYGVKHPIASGVWGRLKVSFRGAIFTVSLNGERMFEAEDHSFAGPGRTGLWTKADSVTYFDDFELSGSQ